MYNWIDAVMNEHLESRVAKLEAETKAFAAASGRADKQRDAERDDLRSRTSFLERQTLVHGSTLDDLDERVGNLERGDDPTKRLTDLEERVKAGLQVAASDHVDICARVAKLEDQAKNQPQTFHFPMSPPRFLNPQEAKLPTLLERVSAANEALRSTNETLRKENRNLLLNLMSEERNILAQLRKQVDDLEKERQRLLDNAKVDKSNFNAMNLKVAGLEKERRQLLEGAEIDKSTIAAQSSEIDKLRQEISDLRLARTNLLIELSKTVRTTFKIGDRVTMADGKGPVGRVAGISTSSRDYGASTSSYTVCWPETGYQSNVYANDLRLAPSGSW